MTEIRLERVSKAFGDKVVIRELDLTIQAGEVFFLLGPSGCGKSTLLRLIAGLHAPTAGRIFFNGRDVTELSTDKRNAAMCFQSYALWPHMTVRDNIRFGLDVRKVPEAESKQRVDEAIALVQLEDQAHKKPNELSGGQQQRVALARALVVRPDCLLLDEPLSNLDAKLRLEMRTEIRKICRAANLTAIYVTHDQKEALSIADRMAVLNEGIIEQIGPPQTLYRQPKNAFVANFMGETNFLEGNVTSVRDGDIRVKTALGELLSAVPGGPRFDVGSRVKLSIRPEVIQIGASPLTTALSPDNTFEGLIRDTLYLGEVAQHLVEIKRTSGNVVLHASEMNPKVVARDGATQSATVRFDPADVIVLPA
jgi:iron(III) transport system ATP-binding protein